mgnify:CR=1 FL=1
MEVKLGSLADGRVSASHLADQSPTRAGNLLECARAAWRSAATRDGRLTPLAPCRDPLLCIGACRMQRTCAHTKRVPWCVRMGS